MSTAEPKHPTVDIIVVFSRRRHRKCRRRQQPHPRPCRRSRSRRCNRVLTDRFNCSHQSSRSSSRITRSTSMQRHQPKQQQEEGRQQQRHDCTGAHTRAWPALHFCLQRPHIARLLFVRHYRHRPKPNVAWPRFSDEAQWPQKVEGRWGNPKNKSPDIRDPP